MLQLQTIILTYHMLKQKMKENGWKETEKEFTTTYKKSLRNFLKLTDNREIGHLL